MSDFATIDDIELLWRELTEDEETRAEGLITVVSSILRLEASKVGKDLDALVEADADYANVVKSVLVDIIARVLMTSTNQEPMSQMSQAAGGYSVSGTFLSPGGGIFIKEAELIRLGLKRQKVGAVNIYE